MPQYSIVIPVYNEVNRIPKNIEKIFSYFQNRSESTEVIFVNDGSSDDTEKILNDYKQKYSFKILSYPENRGKGFAVKKGALAAEGEWVIFFDIDLATPLEEFEAMISQKQPDDQIIIGSRRLDGSKIEKGESGIRTFLGQGFTKISNILVPGVKDFTCGFKGFSKEAAKIIFSRAKIDRWGFDTELLYIAKLHDIKIKQMPVKWAHDENSRVKVFSAVFSSLRELVEMKMNQVKGFYK